MIYAKGQLLMLYDRVKIGDSAQGIVVAIIDDGHYSCSFNLEHWAYLERGVLIKSEQFGLMHYIDIESEPDIVLMRRGVSDINSGND